MDICYWNSYCEFCISIQDFSILENLSKVCDIVRFLMKLVKTDEIMRTFSKETHLLKLKNVGKVSLCSLFDLTVKKKELRFESDLICTVLYTVYIIYNTVHCSTVLHFMQKKDGAQQNEVQTEFTFLKNRFYYNSEAQQLLSCVHTDNNFFITERMHVRLYN